MMICSARVRLCNCETLAKMLYRPMALVRIPEPFESFFNAASLTDGVR
jgi:hypothetical protein